MSLYCKNCGALNAVGRMRCGACNQPLKTIHPSNQDPPTPPWSNTTSSTKNVLSPSMTSSVKTSATHSSKTSTKDSPQLHSSANSSPSSDPLHSSHSEFMSTELIQSVDFSQAPQDQSKQKIYSSVPQSLNFNTPQPSNFNTPQPSQLDASLSPSLYNMVSLSPPSPTSSSTPPPSSSAILWSTRPEVTEDTQITEDTQTTEETPISTSDISMMHSSPPSSSISPQNQALEFVSQDSFSDLPSRTLAPERLAQLYETPQVFIFGGEDGLTQEHIPQPKLWQRAQDLLRFCEPLLTEKVNEASIFLAFELPPRSWLQALHDLCPNGEVLIWLSHWPEGKTGSQLYEGRTSAFFYGEEGLIELAVTLYRLAPFLLETHELDEWWSQVQLRASLVEVEHFQRLLSQPQIDNYLVTLFAQRMRRWARVGKNINWIQLAQASHSLSHYLSQGQSSSQALNFGPPQGSSPHEVFMLAEKLLENELLQRPRKMKGIKIACITLLRSDHPELTNFFEAFGVEIRWFKHPQALLNKITQEYFHWCFLTEYVGPWDGFDLAQEAKLRAKHIKVSISVLARRTHVLARAEHLNIDLLLYPNESTSLQVIALSRAFQQAEVQSGDMKSLDKRLDAIQNAQEIQGLPQRTGVLLIQTQEDQPWLPRWLSEIEELRKISMPKSLSAIQIDDQTIGFPIAIDLDEPIHTLCDQIKDHVHPDLNAGCILNQGARSPKSSIADAYLRLDWAKANEELLVLGWWKSGLEYERSLGAQGAQMLIVDSDPTCVDLLRFFSERAGIMVSTLTNGQAAIDLLDKLQYPPQVIIAECMLPHVNGFQILEVCQKLEKGHPRVILCSAIKRDELIEKAFAMGAADFIYKPFNMAEVMARILHVLS